MDIYIYRVASLLKEKKMDRPRKSVKVQIKQCEKCLQIFSAFTKKSEVHRVALQFQERKNIQTNIHNHV